MSRCVHILCCISGGEVETLDNAPRGAPPGHAHGRLAKPHALRVHEPLAGHSQRAEDQFAWTMHTLELYPEVSGYDRYGLLSERYCPSDGTHSSMCFSYNGRAGANRLEAVRRQEREEADEWPMNRR